MNWSEKKMNLGFTSLVFLPKFYFMFMVYSNYYGSFSKHKNLTTPTYWHDHSKSVGAVPDLHMQARSQSGS